MTNVESSFSNQRFEGDPLPSRSLPPRGPDYDFDADRMNRQSQETVEPAPLTVSIQDRLFSVHDAEADAFVGMLGEDLAQVQKATTNPSALVSVAKRLISNASRTFEAANTSKNAYLAQENAPLLDTLSEADQKRMIIDVLMANRSARERVLEASIADFRQYLASENPAQLLAFDTHFNIKPAVQPAVADSYEKVDTAELDTFVNEATTEIQTNTNPVIFPGSDVARVALGQTVTV